MDKGEAAAITPVFEASPMDASELHPFEIVNTKSPSGAPCCSASVPLLGNVEAPWYV